MIISYHLKNTKLLSQSYNQAKPFKHLVIDNFLIPKVYNQIEKEFLMPKKNAMAYKHFSQNKLALTDISLMGDNTKKLINFFGNSIFLNYLSQITNIKKLIFDKSLHNGGLHETRRGGFLNLHRDFNTHPYQPTWKRRLNIIVYLNNNWKKDWGGELELWDVLRKNCIKKVRPVKNRCIIFDTTNSFHGYPDPIKCPSSTSRKSLALFYFTDEGKRQKSIPTFYTTRSSDKTIKKIIIFFDRQLIKIYNFTLKYLKIKNKNIEKYLLFFFKK